MPGIGPIVAAVLIAWLPELGRLGGKPLASLAGLAPHACDSGAFRGRRRIWGGRRPRPPRALLGGFHRQQNDPVLGNFRRRLTDGGKPHKVAVVATARKLLGILNAMQRDEVDYRPA